ncbi:TPA: hypothetical protein DDW35_02825, partial [Candidatus Sumerlaeota bacterium]|nr:hypothetical protein [Candidatus Sumerlaeota bacterium]
MNQSTTLLLRLSLLALLTAAPHLSALAATDDVPTSISQARVAAPDDPLRVAEVRFEGLKELKSEDLIRLVESQPGTRLERTVLSSDLKRLGERVLTAEVWREKSPQGLIVTFVVQENPTLSEIRFVGNSQLKTKSLEPLTRVKVGE